MHNADDQFAIGRGDLPPSLPIASPRQASTSSPMSGCGTRC